jgi:hypothetical protein
VTGSRVVTAFRGQDLGIKGQVSRARDLGIKGLGLMAC